MQACPLAHSIFLGLNIDDARVVGIDMRYCEVSLFALLGAEPLAQAFTGL